LDRVLLTWARLSVRNIKADRKDAVYFAITIPDRIGKQAVVAESVRALERQYRRGRRRAIEGLPRERHDLIGLRLWNKLIVSFSNDCFRIEIGMRIVNPDVSELSVYLSDNSSKGS
jgi:hypothetical protein